MTHGKGKFIGQPCFMKKNKRESNVNGKGNSDKKKEYIKITWSPLAKHKRNCGPKRKLSTKKNKTSKGAQ